MGIVPYKFHIRKDSCNAVSYGQKSHEISRVSPFNKRVNNESLTLDETGTFIANESKLSINVI
jgi:hypothetical protein